MSATIKTQPIAAPVEDKLAIERSFLGKVWMAVDIDIAMLDLMPCYDDYGVVVNDLREGHILCGSSTYSYRLARVRS